MTRSGPDWRDAVARAIGAFADVRWSDAGASPWARAWRVEAGARTFFVKESSGRFADMLDAEADGLRALAATNAVRVPAIVAAGSAGDTAFVVLEHFPPGAIRDDASLGAALAALHRSRAPHGPARERFGWHRDNWIGGTPQRNGWSDDWSSFFADARLAPQLALAARNGHAGTLQRHGERLLVMLPAVLRGHEPAPSLLHGDLWSGNAAGLPDGTPIIFDPAVYVGDRESDVAMAELFGGFGRDFHAAYRDAWPLDDGYPLRRTLYNLYHVLNHLNLFGGGYLAQAERAIGTLLAAVR
jgi:fructosamine-3-kinase